MDIAGMDIVLTPARDRTSAVEIAKDGKLPGHKGLNWRKERQIMLDLEEGGAVGRGEQVSRDGNVEAELRDEPAWLDPIDEAMGSGPEPPRAILNIA